MDDADEEEDEAGRYENGAGDDEGVAGDKMVDDADEGGADEAGDVEPDAD